MSTATKCPVKDDPSTTATTVEPTTPSSKTSQIVRSLIARFGLISLLAVSRFWAWVFRSAPFIASEQRQVVIKGADIDQTLVIAEQELRKGQFTSTLTLWGIRDQLYTESQAQKVSDLYFRYVDTLKEYFPVWHFTWAISNIYRNGNAAVRAQLERAYQDAKKRAKAAGGFAELHANGAILMGDIHLFARHFVRTHFVAPGLPGYLHSLNDYRQ